MLVSIVSPNLSNNCLGRAYVLAQLIERNQEVEIVGPQFQDKVWEPIKDEYDYRGVKSGIRVHQFPFSVPNFLNQISGDIVYVSKPRLTSYGLGLLATLNDDRLLILDIYDWEPGLCYRTNGRVQTYLKGIPRLVNVSSYYYERSLEALSGVADARTVSNHFLQDRFGGTLVPYAKDTATFNPSQFDQGQVRDELNLPADDFLVMFSGTPRPHKGVDDLVKAVAATNRDDIRAVVVGAHESEYVGKIRRVGGESIIVRGIQPFDEIPKWVAAADVIAIPQKDTPATQGQLPSKVFDAMAMGKPIVATDLNDLSIVLDGCGLIVEPGNIKQIHESIFKFYSDDPLRKTMRKKARQRRIHMYSYDALSEVINNVITGVYKDA